MNERDVSNRTRLYKAVAAHPTYGPGWVDAGLGPPATFISWLLDTLLTCLTCHGSGVVPVERPNRHTGNAEIQPDPCPNPSCVDGKVPIVLWPSGAITEGTLHQDEAIPDLLTITALARR